AILVPFLWSQKNILAIYAVLVKSFACGVLVSLSFNFFTVMFLIIHFYTVINDLRLVQSRMHKQYLRKSYIKSYVFLLLAQIMTLLLFYAFVYADLFKWSEVHLPYLLICLSIALIVFCISLKNLTTCGAKRYAKLKAEQLPTVTLAISARNEDADLENCLILAIASDYPKLEILVLDDNSYDRTPEIIRQYAHDGVRFVQPNPIYQNWLPRNVAYQTLLEQASGQIIMFMGVDVLLSTDTISALVNTFVRSKSRMISVVPNRINRGIVATLVQPMRYWRELVIPKFLNRKPPVISTCWLIEKETINGLGGFKAVAKAIFPETYFAQETTKKSAYLLIRNSRVIKMSTQKDFGSQWQTAIRNGYPLAKKNPHRVFFKTLCDVAFLVGPFVSILFFRQHLLLLGLSAICSALFATSNAIISYVTNRSAFWPSLINFPLVVLLDLIALHYSMYKYEFKEVSWRGRSIVESVMHVYPSLPKL
ncbi:glycosyltransferase, partial [Candidatus Saccharibacteria bacterium]|nr:glycosyltransferase [Candidatus Saccharibacteria bacterium]